MCTVYGTRKEMYVRELYRSVQWVYGNAVNMRVIPLACCTTMQAFRIVHLLYTQGTTDAHNWCTQPVLPVRPFTSGSCTDPYSVCGTMPFEWQYFLWDVVLRCVFSESCYYTYFQNRAAIRIFGIVHLLYGLRCDLIICVHRLIKLWTSVCQAALKSV